MSVTFSGRFNPTGRFRVGPAGGAVATSDPFWTDTLLLINGEGDGQQWYANKAASSVTTTVGGYGVTSTASGKYGKGLAFSPTDSTPLASDIGYIW